LNVGEVALIGHSMGSLIALEAAAQAAGGAGPTVSRLVLVGTAVPMPVSALLLDTARTAPQRAIDLVNGYGHASLGAKPGCPGPGTWHHGADRRLMQQVLARAEAVWADAGSASANLFEHDFSLCNAYAGGLEAAARVVAAGGTRCHVVVGERDRMTAPRAARAVTEALGAQRHGLPAAGHDLMREEPEGLLRALRLALQGAPAD
jgi:pimeloyl-ACP methyl ester carboxylesterase